jgi:hypothetical protein
MVEANIDKAIRLRTNMMRLPAFKLERSNPRSLWRRVLACLHAKPRPRGWGVEVLEALLS